MFRRKVNFLEFPFSRERTVRMLWHAAFSKISFRMQVRKNELKKSGNVNCKITNVFHPKCAVTGGPNRRNRDGHRSIKFWNIDFHKLLRATFLELISTNETRLSMTVPSWNSFYRMMIFSKEIFKNIFFPNCCRIWFLPDTAERVRVIPWATVEIPPPLG